MKTIYNKLSTSFILTLLLLGLPLIGIIFSGKNISNYLEFPPQTQYVEHAGFSWYMFFVLTLVVVIFALPMEIQVYKYRKKTPSSIKSVYTFPWWGWIGLAFGITCWILAWTRFGWFENFQIFTFSPQWFSYIIIINALTIKRTGKCMLIDRPVYFLTLFIASALFWWFFEYLNRFVQNWYYVGIDHLSPVQYFLYATLPFSTVLPAVLGTYDYLVSFPKIGAGLDNYIKINIKKPKLLAWITLIFASFGLLGIGIWPNYLFALLWVSPLLIISTLHSIQGKPTIFSNIKHGTWRRIYLLAMSSLICGFFWEMWNFFSLAKWIYTVPYVSRYKIFEMPFLGYSGYLPFGLECAVIADLFLNKSPKTVKQKNDNLNNKLNNRVEHSYIKPNYSQPLK